MINYSSILINKMMEEKIKVTKMPQEGCDSIKP